MTAGAQVCADPVAVASGLFYSGSNVDHNGDTDAFSTTGGVQSGINVAKMRRKMAMLSLEIRSRLRLANLESVVNVAVDALQLTDVVRAAHMFGRPAPFLSLIQSTRHAAARARSPPVPSPGRIRLSPEANLAAS